MNSPKLVQLLVYEDHLYGLDSDGQVWCKQQVSYPKPGTTCGQVIQRTEWVYSRVQLPHGQAYVAAINKGGNTT
jgi:hypothetical protein